MRPHPHAYLEFLWDEKSHLISFAPTAKRRRCNPCKQLALELEALPPKMPVESVGRKRKESSR